jgi:hypothetical protein
MHRSHSEHCGRCAAARQEELGGSRDHMGKIATVVALALGVASSDVWAATIIQTQDFSLYLSTFATPDGLVFLTR